MLKNGVSSRTGGDSDPAVKNPALEIASIFGKFGPRPMPLLVPEFYMSTKDGADRLHPSQYQ